ncbi:MAG TPA: MFS transporter [Candidatus Nitrosotalea sp.]|nr:MFS transporter [Candidatus Nitrosotalea sp.]
MDYTIMPSLPSLERVQAVPSHKWMWYILPGQVTNQGLNIVIPLYIISLGGGIGEIAIVSAIQNAAIAIGSIFWGKIIDRFHSRRFILLTSFFAVLLCSIFLYLTSSIAVLYAIAPVLGFFIVGRNPVTQLLVMESVQKNLWSWLFARTSVISTLGMLVAMAIGTVDSAYFNLKPYFLICAASSGVAMALSMSVKGGGFHLERSSVAHSLHGLHYTISHYHFVFPKIPELYDFRHIITIFRGKISNEIGIFSIAIFCFNLGSNMYSTAWSPFLVSRHFSNSAVFLNYMIQMVAMLLIFFAAPRIISRMGEERATALAFLPRILAVVIPAVTIPIMIGSTGAMLAVVSSCLLVIGFSIFSTSSSVIFFKSIPQGFEGKYLGVNSAVTGTSVFAGALITGEFTKAFGYSALFLSAAAILGLSLALFGAYFRYRLTNKSA